MEVKNIGCGAELVLCPVDEQVGEVRLLMKPFPADFEVPEGVKAADPGAIIDMIAPYIIGWNLELEGAAIPCTDEKKREYLGYLLRLEVKPEDDEKEGSGFAAMRIVEFATNIANFLKN